MLLCVGGAYLAALEGKYRGLATLLLPAAILPFLLDSVLFKEILFYQDRVVKIWHFFGKKAIRYSNGSVSFPEWYMRWLSSAHFIFESKENGRPVPMRMPLLYNAFFFSVDSAKQIEKIMAYLTEYDERHLRKFKKATLPKEVLCQTPWSLE